MNREKLTQADYQQTFRARLKAKDLAAFRERERHFNCLTRYGIGLKEYDALLAKQNGVCAICSRPAHNGVGKRLHVDHHHNSKVVRGLLCHGCNTGLGAFGEDIAFLSRAITYLTENQESGLAA